MHTLSFDVDEVASTSEQKRTVTQTVSRCTELLIDGRSARSLVEQPGQASALDSWPLDVMVEALRSGRMTSLGWPDEKRVPLFVCGDCGDPACGAVTCRVTVGPTTVTWSDVAWENFYEPNDTAVLDALTWIFDRAAYDAALACVVEQSAAIVESEVRAEGPRRWWREPARRLVPGGVAHSLDWLFCDVVEPDIAYAEGSLGDFFDDAEDAQATLAGVRLLDDAALAQLIGQLERVRDSLHAVRLPPQTRDAIANLIKAIARDAGA